MKINSKVKFDAYREKYIESVFPVAGQFDESTNTGKVIGITTGKWLNKSVATNFTVWNYRGDGSLSCSFGSGGSNTLGKTADVKRCTEKFMIEQHERVIQEKREFLETLGIVFSD